MVQIILVAMLSAAVQLVLPWWSTTIVAFIICFWRGDSAGKAFLYGFVGVALPWLLYAIALHLRTGGVFTERMSELLFKSSSTVLPIIVTTVLGGLVGGLGGLSGYFVQQAVGSQTARSIP